MNKWHKFNRRRSMAKRQGFLFEKEIANSLARLQESGFEFFWWKIADTHAFDFSLYCQHCGQKMKSPLILPEVIGDFVLFGDKKAMVIEAKSTQKDFFPTANIKKHQIRDSLMINAYDSVEYRFLFNDRRVPHHYRCFSMDPDDYDDAIAESNKSSQLPWHVIAQESEELDRLPGMMWDLSPLIRLIA